MTFTIFKGMHRAWPLRLGFFANKRSIKKAVTFSENCRYTGLGDDQLDMNKLYGLSYTWSPHGESARFSWRYSEGIQKIVLGAYCYVNGDRINTPLRSVQIGDTVILEIRIEGGRYWFYADGKLLHTVPFTHRKKYAYPLGLFFGGNRKAPHKMTAALKNF
jgi:hypothetical protein